MRELVLGLCLFALVPGTACGKNCSKVTQDLQRLRNDYHKYVTSAPAGGMPVTFDGLASILDKIIDLKHEMEKSGCPVPPRRNVSDQKR